MSLVYLSLEVLTLKRILPCTRNLHPKSRKFPPKKTSNESDVLLYIFGEFIFKTGTATIDTMNYCWLAL